MPLLQELQKIVSQQECRKNILQNCIDSLLKYDQQISAIEFFEIKNLLKKIRDCKHIPSKPPYNHSDYLIQISQNESYVFDDLESALSTSTSKANVVVALSLAVEKISILEKRHTRDIAKVNLQKAISKLERHRQMLPWIFSECYRRINDIGQQNLETSLSKFDEIIIQINQLTDSEIISKKISELITIFGIINNYTQCSMQKNNTYVFYKVFFDLQKLNGIIPGEVIKEFQCSSAFTSDRLELDKIELSLDTLKKNFDAACILNSLPGLQQLFESALSSYIRENDKYDQFEEVTKKFVLSINKLYGTVYEDSLKSYKNVLSQYLVLFQIKKGLANCKISKTAEDIIQLSKQGDLLFIKWLKDLHYNSYKIKLEADMQAVPLNNLTDDSFNQVFETFIRTAEKYNIIIEQYLAFSTESLQLRTVPMDEVVKADEQKTLERMKGVEFVKLNLIKLLNNFQIEGSAKNELLSCLENELTITGVIGHFKEKLNHLLQPSLKIQKWVLFTKKLLCEAIQHEQKYINYPLLISKLMNIKTYMDEMNSSDDTKAHIHFSVVNTINSAIIDKFNYDISLELLIKHIQLLSTLASLIKNTRNTLSKNVQEIKELFDIETSAFRDVCNHNLQDVKQMLNMFLENNIMRYNLGVGIDSSLDVALKLRFVKKYSDDMENVCEPKGITEILDKMQTSLERLEKKAQELDGLKKLIINAKDVLILIKAIDVYMETRYAFIDEEFGEDLGTKKLELGGTSFIVSESIQQNTVLSTILRPCQDKLLPEMIYYLNTTYIQHSSPRIDEYCPS